MNKSSAILSLIFALFVCIYPSIGYSEQDSQDVIREGSFANSQLIQDTLYGVVGKAATLGCQKIDAYKPYIVEMPDGEPGSRAWRERWMVTCQGTDYPIDIRFKETGLDAADYLIE